MNRGFTRVRAATVCVLVTTACESTAHAGMTVYGLRDIYRVRLEDISFFIFVFVTCSFILQLLWNHAIKEFSSIPRLTFLRSLSVAAFLGLSMLLILTMISGIREVLTPEAWRHQGSSYRLNAAAQEPARRRSLEQLRAALFDYARAHNGTFPAHDYVPEIADKLWEAPDQLGTHYLYSGGLTTNLPNAVLAVEPSNFGDQRLGLKVSGEIGFLSKADVETRAVGQSTP